MKLIQDLMLMGCPEIYSTTALMILLKNNLTKFWRYGLSLDTLIYAMLL